MVERNSMRFSKDRPALRFEPSCNVDPGTHQVAVALLDDVAEMDANTVAEPGGFASLRMPTGRLLIPEEGAPPIPG
jgi:hypothetical protein